MFYLSCLSWTERQTVADVEEMFDVDGCEGVWTRRGASFNTMHTG
jgi:hypothetical protein